jgi:carbohydrate kinase (thermoresistant glucokinase family)
VIVIVMGVSGAGKSTLGRPLAKRLGWKFLDADDFHPPANVAKMAAGKPLDDADRWPWLDRINQELLGFEKRGKAAVLACSALKESYRKRLTAGLARFEIVFLHGDFELIRERLAQRKHRFMPPSLLESQYATLEPPTKSISIDVARDPEAVLAEIVAKLKR